MVALAHLVWGGTWHSASPTNFLGLVPLVPGPRLAHPVLMVNTARSPFFSLVKVRVIEVFEAKLTLWMSWPVSFDECL